MKMTVAVCAVLILASYPCVSQEPQSQIVDLIHSFQETVQEGRTPSALLSPSSPDHDAQLKQFVPRFQTFDARYSPSEIHFTNDNHAEVPATIEWSRTESHLSRHTTIKFERINGRWYFTDFNFMTFPYLLFFSIALAGFLVGMLILVAYLKMRKKLQARRGSL